MVDSVRAIFKNFEQVLVYQRRVMNLLVSFDDYEDPMKHFAAEEWSIMRSYPEQMPSSIPQ